MAFLTQIIGDDYITICKIMEYEYKKRVDEILLDAQLKMNISITNQNCQNGKFTFLYCISKIKNYEYGTKYN